jgi:type II secretory pathway component PulF
VLAGMGGTLPLSTRLLLQASHVVIAWWWLWLVLVVAGVVAARQTLAQPGVRM